MENEDGDEEGYGGYDYADEPGYENGDQAGDVVEDEDMWS